MAMLYDIPQKPCASEIMLDCAKWVSALYGVKIRVEIWEAGGGCSVATIDHPFVRDREAPAADSALCKVNLVSSRVCELGTKSCTVNHEVNG